MAERFVLMRRMSGRGGALAVPVRVFDTESEAKTASATQQAQITQLLDAELALVSGDTATPCGLSLRQFLASFGVESVGHEPLPVQSGLIDVAPAPKIILSS